MDRKAIPPYRRTSLVRLLTIVGGLLLLAFSAGDARAPSAGAQSIEWTDVTADAVQTFYQNGVPALPNNQRFFPNGLYFVTGGPEDANAIQTLHDAGFTVALGSGLWEPGVYVDAAEGTNVRVVIDQSQHAHGGSDPYFDEEWFAAYKDNPRVLAWLLYDEPVGIMKYLPETPDLLPAIQAIYDAHKDGTEQLLFIDEQSLPDHPDWPAAVTMTDVAAHYAYLKSVFSPTASLEPIARSVALQTALVNEAKPSWFLPQAYHGYPVAAFPTPAKARAQAYAAIIHGATGLIHFTWDSSLVRQGSVIGVRPDTPASYGTGLTAPPAIVDASRALWGGLDTRSGSASLNRQLLALTEPLLAPTATAPYTVEVGQAPISPAPIRTLLKEYAGDLYLLAVNLDNATIDARFTFEAQHAITRLFSPSDGGDRQISDQITDTFKPFDTRAYRLDGCPDLTGDGSAASDDVAALIDAYGADAGFSPAYRVDWDASGDGTIDPVDLQRFADAADGSMPGCAPCPDGDSDGVTDCQEQALGSDPGIAEEPCFPYAPDIDGDGLLNAEEVALGTDSCVVDSDGDGMGDGYEEARPCLSPLLHDGSADPDADGIASADEAAGGTQPCVADTDGDGCSDGDEAGSEPAFGGARDPLNPYDFFDVPLPVGPPGTGTRDSIVAVRDIMGVLAKFGTREGAPPSGSGQVYNIDYDRTRAGSEAWMSGPPDGVVSVVDIYLAINQFGHTCYKP
jgi:hypothetical protein